MRLNVKFFCGIVHVINFVEPRQRSQYRPSRTGARAVFCSKSQEQSQMFGDNGKGVGKIEGFPEDLESLPGFTVRN